MTGRVTALVRQSCLRPANWLPSLRAALVLWHQYAHLRSVRLNRAVDAEGEPTPWYTYPAIEFLSQLDFRDRTVFEYGSGMSTLFWAKRARLVVSAEDDERWFEEIARNAPANCRLLLETDLDRFPDVLRRTDEQFDVIVVDGPARGRTRLKCCRAALAALRPGGLVVLDNSDWLPESSRLLRESGLLEVDMTGFAPVCGHTQTTSLFFDRSFNVASLTDRQPMAGRGSRPANWEEAFVAVPGDVVECAGERFRGAEDRLAFGLDSLGAAHWFEGFTYLGCDGVRCIALIDRTAGGRVLLTRHAPGCRHPGAELSRIAGLPWSAFQAFINTHPARRYCL